MFFQKRSKNRFVDVKGADRWSKVRFWSHFGTKGDPENEHWGGAISAEGVAKGSVLPTRGATFSAPGRDLAPKTRQNDPRIEFHRFLNVFLYDFGRLSDSDCINLLISDALI